MIVSELKQQYKVILIGEMNIRKTSIIIQFIKHEFDTIDFSSFGSQFIQNEIFKGKFIIFDIWDTIRHKEIKDLS